MIGGFEVAPSYQFLSGTPWILSNNTAAQNFVQTANLARASEQFPSL